MSDFRRADSGREEPSVDAIRRTDSFIDALAAGRSAAPQDAADAELAALLGNWRDETRWPPATGLISESDAVAALNAGLAEKRPENSRERWAPAPKRSRRGLSVVGAAAAAVLSIGGFGAVVAGAGPDDALYGLRAMLFGTSTQVRDDQVALAARTEMNQVQDLIARGDWQQAQDKLVSVSTQVASIGDDQQKQQLLDQFNDLSAKVVERDPAATAPPGIIYTVPPEATELVPAVAPPTSTPGAPPPTDSATPATSETTSPEAASPETTSPEAASPETTSPEAASAEATSPEAASPETTSPEAASAEATTPETTSPPTTSVAQRSQPTTTPTTTAPAAAAATTTSAAPEPETATTPATTDAPITPGAEATVQDEPAEAETESEPPVVVTTTEVPVPAGG